MNETLSNTDLILVAIMPSTRDLEIARLLGWYRIPLRFAPKIIDVDYLAFYQTGAFGEEHKWCIEYYAEVSGHELTRRKDLFQDEVGHPRANEEYYKLTIGPVMKLDRPIRAGKWRRITFLFTTGQKFHVAEVVKDLVVKNDERSILWNSLRERAMNNDLYLVKDFPEFPLDTSLLALLGDMHFIKDSQWTNMDY